ncbi:MAG: PAS domain S-box protein [Bacteroidota bacterium]|nr:PAS domain S-box protein [Bacteroidota bacterium]
MRNKTFYILLIFYLFILKTNAQNNIDSSIIVLENKLPKIENVANKIITINELSVLYRQVSANKALEYSKLALEKSLTAKNPFWTSESYRNIGWAEFMLGRNSFARKNFELAYKNDKKSNNISSEIKTHITIGDFYVQIKKIDKAINSYYDALRLLEMQGAKSKASQLHIKLGSTYFKIGDSSKCLEYYIKSRSYFEIEKDTLELGSINNKIGIVYKKLKQPDKAIAYFTKSINLFRAIKADNYEFDPLLNIGSIYLTEGKYDLSRHVFVELHEKQKITGNSKNNSIIYQKIAQLENTVGNTELAIQYLDSALQIEKKQDEKDRQCHIFCSLGKLYFKLSRNSKAIGYLKLASQKALQTNDKHSLALIYSLFSEIYESSNNLNKALENSKLHSIYKDSLAMDELENSRLSMKANILIEEKQRENELLKIDNRVKGSKIEQSNERIFYFIILISIIILIFIASYLLFKEKIKYGIKLRAHKKLYEEVLKKHKITETKYEAVVEQSYDIIFIQKDDRIIFANKKAIMISGYPEDELYTIDINRFLHPVDLQKYQKQNKNPMKVGESRTFISRVIDKYGNVFTFEIIRRMVVMSNEEVKIGVGRDLTERVEAEEALRKSNQRNKNLIENSPSGILYINQNGDIVEINPSAGNILDFPKNDSEESKKYYDIFPDNDTKITSYIRKCFEDGIVVIDDCQFKNLKSEVMYMSFSLAPIKNKNGSVHSVIMNFNNITDKKKAEQELRILEERYELAFEGTTLGLWDWELASGKMIFNDQFYSILGYKRGELVENRNTLEHLIYSNDRFVVQEILDKHINDDTSSYIAEYRILTNNGYWKWVSDHGKVVLRNDNGYPLRMVGTIRDITARKNAEDNLLQSEKKYRSLIENMQDGVFIIRERKLVFVNHALAWITGYKIDELLGLDYSKLLKEQDIAIIERNRTKLLNEKDSKNSYETSILHKDGKSVVQINLSIGVIEYEGNKAIHGTVKDITDKKRAERILKKSEKSLRMANATKDKFFSIIAHDLKNPFNAIMGFAHLLNEEYNNFSDDDKKRFIKNIWEASENTYKLVENLLQWSRAQTGKMPFQAIKIDLSTIVNENISILSPNAERKGVKLFSEISFNSNVRGDVNMLTTVVRNLLSNAIKFTNSGDKVVISCKRNKDYTEICVMDNGIGISEENQKKLFQFGEQYKTEGTANERGTGLGLILCKEFIDRHKGKLWVESEPGKGSKFCFTVPIFRG